MNFQFNARKATQVAARLIEKAGGSTNVMKLVKLIYLLDRLSLDRRGIPVLGGSYYSMKNGPVASEVLDLINSGYLSGVETDWQEYISDRNNHTVALTKSAGRERLSDSEVEMINEIYVQHGGKNQFQLRDWCHDNCAEWHPITEGRKEIPVENILEVLGRTGEEISEICEFEHEARFISELLT